MAHAPCLFQGLCHSFGGAAQRLARNSQRLFHDRETPPLNCRMRTTFRLALPLTSQGKKPPLGPRTTVRHGYSSYPPSSLPGYWMPVNAAMAAAVPPSSRMRQKHTMSPLGALAGAREERWPFDLPRRVARLTRLAGRQKRQNGSELLCSLAALPALHWDSTGL